MLFLFSTKPLTENRLNQRSTHDPQVFCDGVPRSFVSRRRSSHGEVYICGVPEELEVPDDPERVLPRKDPITILQRVARTISSQLASADVQVEQACFLPCSDDGKPVIGKLPDMSGAYVATGHSCWGILNAPATGASLAELILDGHVNIVDLKPFDPARFIRRSRRS